MGPCPLVGASTAPRFERRTAERGRVEGAEPFAPSLVCDNSEVLVRLAECSDAIAFGPGDLHRAYPRAGRLKLVAWPLEGPDTQPSLIRSRRRLLSPAAERLVALFACQSAGAEPT